MPDLKDQPHQLVPYQTEPKNLPIKARWVLFEAVLRSCAENGWKRIALFPAGRQSERLDLDVLRKHGLELVAVLDDVKTGHMHGIAISKIEDRIDDLDAVVIYSDNYEQECAHRARGFGVPVLCPYQVLQVARRKPEGELVDRFVSAFTGKLNLGCGTHPLKGWSNVDGGDNAWYYGSELEEVVELDAFDALASLPDCSCDYITSEHFYEHFTLDEGFKMAQEWARVLRPGGVVRVVNPDLEKEARIYLGDLKATSAEQFDRHKRRWLNLRHKNEVDRFLTPAMLFNFGMRLDGHLFLYDFETLKAQLEAVGLVGVTRCKFGQSEHDALRGIDQHDGAETGGDWIKAIQLVVEASKPTG
jgi:predicted SAM-dependent methyltransferase